MKRLLWLAGLALLTGCPHTPIPAIAQNVEGQAIASQYGQFQLQGTAENSFVFSPSTCQVAAGNKNFAALTQGVPVRIIQPGDTAHNETVTAGLVNINVCSVQLTPTYDHLPPFYVTSGTAGLQEAINANAAAGPANTIILDAGFYALGGTTGIITSVVGGSTNLGLVDITTTPYTWYAWGGSAYAKVAVSGGNPGGSTGAFQTNGGGSFAGTVVTGLVKGNGTSAPTAAVPGTDYQTPIANSCSAGITCPLTGSTYNFSYSGSAGSGTVGTGNQYQDATYPGSGATTAVGALTNRYTVPTGLSSTQLNTLFSGLSSSTATIQNGDGTTPFANPNFDGVRDLRETYPVTPWDVKESGAQCDLQAGFASLTSGSPTLTVTSGYSLSAADVGKYIEMVYEVAGEPTRFDATITSVTNSTTATLSTNAPFTVSEYSMDIGHRDDAAIAAAFGQWSYRRPIEFPVGNCWSDTITVWGQSFHGLSSTRSLVTGLAGDDVFAAYDPANPDYQGQSTDMQIYDMKWEFDPRINASQPWQDVNASGTVTQHAATYRPVGLMTAWANYPLGPGWIVGTGPNNTGAINGVASTNGTTSIAVTSATVPVVGQQIVFPYASTGVFVTTVSAVTGSAVTLANAYPVSGSQTQQEWMAGAAPGSVGSGTAVQEIETSIPATGRTFPMTITLANPITPPLTPNWAGTASNVAPYGLVQIGSEQFSYFGDSAYPASAGSTPTITLTAGAQNGTTAASHSVGAAIVPLNPFQPTWPWPVAPSINSGVTPANATFFPAWNIGNAAWAEPWYDGTYPASGGGLSFARMHDITMTILDYGSGSGGGTEGGPNSFQMSNATTGMYITRLPYKSKFYNLHIVDPQFGIFEGEPSTNTYGLWNAYPTADGSSWENITIQSAGYDLLFIGGQSDSKKDFLTFCQNGGETGTSNPGQALGIVGCGAVWIWGGTYDDQSNGGGSDNTHAILENWYVEAETGSQEEMQPYYEFNCGLCTYHIGVSGGVAFLEGSQNNFTETNFNAANAYPLINYGAYTTMQYVQSASIGGNGNTYGSNALINYGPSGTFMGQTDNLNGPYGSIAAGNNLAPVFGQTGEALETGNDALPYISSSSAMIYPDQFQLSLPWIFDDSAPISHSYATCYISSGTGCSGSHFNGNSVIIIGRDQKLVAGQYVAHYAFKVPTGATNFTFQLGGASNGGSCTPATVLSTTIAGTTSWVQGTSGPLNFSGVSGCVLSFNMTGSPDPATVEMAYLILTPVWTNITLPVNTPADNVACTSGAFLGSDASYLYICTASGTVKRVALSTY